MKKIFYINPATVVIDLRGETLLDTTQSTGTHTDADPDTNNTGGMFGAPGRGMRL